MSYLATLKFWTIYWVNTTSLTYSYPALEIFFGGRLKRFFCYAGDRNEPPHIHIERDREVAKFWFQPIRLQTNQGFSRTKINRIQKLIQENQEQLLTGWNDFFND